MSRPALTVAAGLAVAMIAPAAIAAQSTDPVPAPRVDARESPERLRARLDSLRPLVERAKRDLDAREAAQNEIRRRAAAEAASVDTLRIGGASVLTPSEQADMTRELFTAVWERHFAALAPGPAMDRLTFVFQRVDREPVPIHVEDGAHVLYQKPWHTRSSIERSIRGLVAGALSQDLRRRESNVGRWVWGDALHPEPWDATYRRVATTSSRVTRACLAGDPGACGSALGIGTSKDQEQLEEWYTPEERRALVGRLRYSRSNAPARRACLRDRDMAACDEFLLGLYTDQRGRYFDRAPLGPEERESLLSYALGRGGAGAWDRLLEDPEMPVTDALEHAAGEPIASILAGWRAELVEHRPVSFEPLVPSSGRTLLWTLLCAALALRSSRWRLG